MATSEGAEYSSDKRLKQDSMKYTDILIEIYHMATGSIFKEVECSDQKWHCNLPLMQQKTFQAPQHLGLFAVVTINQPGQCIQVWLIATTEYRKPGNNLL